MGLHQQMHVQWSLYLIRPPMGPSHAKCGPILQVVLKNKNSIVQVQKVKFWDKIGGLIIGLKIMIACRSK